MTDPLLNLLPLAKVLLAFGVMLAGLRLRQPLWLSVLVGGFLMALTFHMGPLRWAETAALSILHRETYFLMLILTLILFLSQVLEQSGQTRRLMRAATSYLTNPRVRLAFFPALVGLLPMPGGAVFSAPMVRDLGSGMGLRKRDAALINYWFRHLWELCWPLYPGIILASVLSGAPLTRLATYTWPCIGVCILLGWIFVMRPAMAAIAPAPDGGSVETDAPARDWRALLREGLPMLIAIGGGLGFEMAMTAWLPGLPFELGVVTALVLAIICALIQNRLGPAFTLTVLKNRELYRLIGLVLAIFIFKDVLQEAGAVDQLARSASGPGAVIALAMGLPFLVGLISGITVAFVGATFPIILGVLHNIGAGPMYMPVLTLALFSGYTGVLVSPLHVCFILSCRCIGADMGQAWRRLIAPCCLFWCFGVVWFLYLARAAG